eukprot:CAMPEP_0170640150 /NCGR_PEP_ID=MMETSP0224-20130122/40054_1 /TAXON_ID=285029 /ORGANISM="Togula jolla, Strain CCCM 725" /LENGTH=230 /DNA_ID=CAMNT_0010970603 /DNA_START=13 /DNA_END=702 /DNA_ORIENTATION=-
MASRGALRTATSSSASTATAAVVFGHGLGDTPDGWREPCQLWSQRLPWIRFALPAAPTRNVTFAGGMQLPAWYDITGLPDRLKEKAEGIEESRSQWTQYIETEASHVGGMDRVVLGGFSQGGAMALDVALSGGTSALPAGVLCMSGYLPNKASVVQRASTLDREALAELPVLLCHGIVDEMVTIDTARRTRDALLELGLRRVELLEYSGMGHEATMEELDDVADWLKRQL